MNGSRAGVDVAACVVIVVRNLARGSEARIAAEAGSHQ
jgi:hypothetical protein